MKRGTTDVNKVFRGTTEINKVVRGTTTIWENWKEYTTNLYTMTSNTSPAPFSASLLTNVTTGVAWNAFNNALSPNIQNNFKEVSEGLGARINFGEPIRIVQVTARGDRSGQSVFPLTLIGVTEQNTDITIFNGNITAATSVTVNSTNTTTPFIAMKVFGQTRTDLIVVLNFCQVTRYWKRG